MARSTLTHQSTADSTGIEDYFSDAPSLRKRVRHRRKDTFLHAVNEQYESLEYELPENELVKQEERSYNFSLLVWKRNWNRWVICFLIGLITAIAGTLVQLSVSYLSYKKYHFLTDMINRCMADGCRVRPLAYWVLINVVCAGFAAILTVFVAPVTAGSGIPQIKCFLNGVKVPGVLRLKTGIIKLIGVVAGVLGGLAIGKEGPMIHFGAVVAGGISQGRLMAFRLDLKIFDFFRSDREKRDFVSAGAAAGVAAAFNAPVGGVLFSMEEGASYWTQPLTWRTFFAAMVCHFMLNFFTSTISGHPEALFITGLINLGAVQDYFPYMFEVPIFVLMGLFGGLNGALFNHVNRKLTIFRMHYMKTRVHKVLEVMAVAGVSAILFYALILNVNGCYPLDFDTEDKDLVQIYCEDGQYNELGFLLLSSPEDAVKHMFHYKTGSFNMLGLFVLCIAYWGLTVWTYGLHIPSGIFIPLLLIGSCWGRLTGYVLSQLVPHAAYMFQPAKYAMIGAAAQMGGVLRMTISLCVILMESTQSMSLGLALTVALLVAKFVGDKFNEGLYDIHIRLMEVPMLPWEPPSQASAIPATKVMSPRVQVLPLRIRARQLLVLLRSDFHHAYPVVSNRKSTSIQREELKNFGKLEGIITRNQLIVILGKRAFMPDEMNGQEPGPVVTLKDFRDPYPRYSRWLDDADFREDELERFIDLEPYMDPSPYFVRKEASLRRLFVLFRQLGLRHCVVVDKDSRVVGIVTRKDVARFREERIEDEKRYTVTEVHINRPDRKLTKTDYDHE